MPAGELLIKVLKKCVLKGIALPDIYLLKLSIKQHEATASW